jgi:hypothetical protein
VSEKPNEVLTVSRSRKLERFCLNNLMIWVRVPLRFGMTTPRVDRAAMSIIFLNDGCSKA